MTARHLSEIQIQSEAIAAAFARRQSALPDDGAGVSTFPRISEYLRQQNAANPKLTEFARATRHSDIAIQQVRLFRYYQAGWDGFDSARPNGAAISDACNLLPRLQHDPVFVASAEPDGSINLTLAGGAAKLTLVFDGSGAVQILSRKDRAWSDEGTFPIVGPMPGRTTREIDDAVGAAI